MQSGARSLRSREFGETFHPVVGPMAEARALHVAQQRLVARAGETRGPFVIWDVGLGFRQRILALAQNEVGTLEATGNNDGDVTKYPGMFGRGQESYCADFASWVITNAGGSLNDPWCPSIKNQLINSGNWKGRTDPQPGDIVLFDWDGDNVADHVGLVKSVYGNGTLTTIEGNTGGPNGAEGVWEKVRGWDFVMGFGNPI